MSNDAAAAGGAAAPDGSGVRRGEGLLLVANWRSDVGYAWRFMERIWVALAERHALTGGGTHLIYPDLRSVPGEILEAGIRVHELDFADRSGPSLEALRMLVRRERIRAIYLTDRPTLDPLYAKLRWWGVRRFVNNDQTPGDRATTRVKWLAKAAAHGLRLGSCDLYVAPSRFVLERFRRVYALPESRCFLIPNGIEPIDPESAERRYLEREFGIPAAAVVVVSLSRAVHYKGIPFIIDCADRLINGEGRRDLYFVHCGDGPDLAEFRGRVLALGLEERVLLPGARPDYRTILPACDIALHASRGEGFSLAVLECMSAGLALVVPDNSGNREAVTHGLSGCCFTPGDLAEATLLLRELIDDAGVRRRLGAGARAVVLERFTLERTLRNFREVAGDYLSAGRWPARRTGW